MGYFLPTTITELMDKYWAIRSSNNNYRINGQILGYFHLLTTTELTIKVKLLDYLLSFIKTTEKMTKTGLFSSIKKTV